jgi:hypothetical protein
MGNESSRQRTHTDLQLERRKPGVDVLQQLTEIGKTLGGVNRVGTFRGHDGCGREAWTGV